MKPTRRVVLSCAMFTLSAAASIAQELTPRSYWPAPKGTKVAILGYSFSRGDVVTDPSLPVVGVDSRINASVFGYLQILNLWGRTAHAVVEVPYLWGTTVGDVADEPRRRDFSGLGDLGVTLSVNLLGAPSMTPADFQELRENPHAILGASVKVLTPTGDYEKDKLINVGANRWAVKAELGYIVPIKANWLLELELGAWVFGENDEFLGVTREQRPVVGTQLHVIRRFKPGFWASLDLTYFQGGRSIIDGELAADLQRNSRLGGTIVVPFLGRHAIKVGYSTGVVTESGGDYSSFLLSYQVLFH